jgi:hypothetical protein
VSTPRSFHAAVDAAATHDRRRRRLRATVLHLAVIVAALAALIPVVSGREVDNPDYPGARALADRMEAAYRAVDAGTADIGSFTVEDDGFSGGVFEVDRAGVVNDYFVLAGSHLGDCFVLRWVRFEVPFVGRLLPRFDCVPSRPMLNFSPSAWEAIAPNVTSRSGLEWYPVVPDPLRLAPWFFPLTLVLGGLALQQAISLSVVHLRGGVLRKVPVERVEGTGSAA